MNATTTLTLESIEAFRQSLVVRSLSENTIRAYSSDLRLAQSWVAENLPTEVDLETAVALWLNDTRDEAKPRTSIRRLATTKAYAKWLGNPLFLHDYRPPSPTRPTPHPIPEGMDGVRMMCELAPNAQAEALFAMQGMLGMRVTEALSLTPKSFDLEDDTILIRGKGDKERIVPLLEDAWKHIAVAYEFAVMRGTTLVNYSDRGGRAMVTSMGKQLGFKKPISSHDLRATFATDMLRRTGNIRLVQEWLGHASIKTTEVYTQITTNDLREGAER